MEDCYYAGGLPALLAQLARVPGALHQSVPDHPVYNDDVIRTPDTALANEGGIAVLRGNLAPDGAVIKHIAADPRLLKHTGPAVVFDDYADLKKRVNDPSLNITPDSVMVLRNTGPKGAGMPEYGQLPIPDYLLARGIRDMVRISDARMSGTSYGACVLHVAPESAVGGPLALVETGDLIPLDVPARVLSLDVPERTVAARRATWTPPEVRYGRGYGALYSGHITQANKGWDFGFFARRQPSPRPAVGCRRDEHADRPSERRLPGTRGDPCRGAARPACRGRRLPGKRRGHRADAAREPRGVHPLGDQAAPDERRHRARHQHPGARHPAFPSGADRPVRRRRPVRPRRPPGGGPRERRVRHRLDRAGGRHVLLRGGRRRGARGGADRPAAPVRVLRLRCEADPCRGLHRAVRDGRLPGHGLPGQEQDEQVPPRPGRLVRQRRPRRHPGHHRDLRQPHRP